MASWSHALKSLDKANYLFAHVYREGNDLADGLAKKGALSGSIFRGSTIPDDLTKVYTDDCWSQCAPRGG